MRVDGRRRDWFAAIERASRAEMTAPLSDVHDPVALDWWWDDE